MNEDILIFGVRLEEDSKLVTFDGLNLPDFYTSCHKDSSSEHIKSVILESLGLYDTWKQFNNVTVKVPSVEELRRLGTDYDYYLVYNRTCSVWELFTYKERLVRYVYPVVMFGVRGDDVYCLNVRALRHKTAPRDELDVAIRASVNHQMLRDSLVDLNLWELQYYESCGTYESYIMYDVTNDVIHHTGVTDRTLINKEFYVDEEGCLMAPYEFPVKK